MTRNSKHQTNHPHPTRSSSSNTTANPRSSKTIDIIDKEKLKVLLENVDVGLTIVDPDFTVLWTNSIVTKWFDKKPGTYVGKKCYKEFAKRDQVCPNCPGLKAMETGEFQEVVTEGVRDDGSRFTVRDKAFPLRDSNGKIIGFNEIIEDITEPKKQEEMLRATELRLRSLIETTTDAVSCYEYDPPIPLDLPIDEQVIRLFDGILVDGNLATARVHGYNSLEQALGVKFSDLPGLNENVKEIFRKAVKGGYKIVDAETSITAVDGTEFFVVVNAYGIIENGQVIRVWSSLRDITERKRAQLELQNAQRLESLGILAGGIAHDFNNLLSGLFGYIDLARSNLKTDIKAKEYLDHALSCFEQTKNLTLQLLTFSKGGAPVLKTVFIDSILKESQQLTLSGSNIKCIMDIQDEIKPIKADPGQLNQVFNNILINSRQAMLTGGIITIQVTNRLDMDKSKYSIPEGEYIQVTIKDQGTGIPPDLLSKAFDPFFTTKQEGSGLGLATSYSIIKKHEGFIFISSKLGIGTTVTVFLPVTDEELSHKEKTLTPVTHSQGKILIMDNEEFILDVASAMLEEMGFIVDQALNGEKTINLYEKSIARGSKYDLVILDLTVPGSMGGAATMEKLLILDKEVKGVVSSGYSDNPILAHPQEYGFCGRIMKPFGMTELSQVICEVLSL